MSLSLSLCLCGVYCVFWIVYFLIVQVHCCFEIKVWNREKIVIIPDHYIFTSDERANCNVDILKDFSSGILKGNNLFGGIPETIGNVQTLEVM
jgi:homoaconitase/3-isopropylmalate dehydratase large subunit